MEISIGIREKDHYKKEKGDFWRELEIRRVVVFKFKKFNWILKKKTNHEKN